MPPRHGGATDIGRVRKKNEDSFAVHLPTAEEAARGSLYVVADGVGGEAAGEAASQLAVETVIREYYAYPEPDPPAALRLAVERANAAVHASSSDRRATTLVAAAVVGETLHVASVGDSRLYLVRAGEVRQVTLDHSWVQEQVRAGNIDPDAAKAHPLGNVITRWIGQPSVEPDLFALPLEQEDRIVICSDGLFRYVPEAVIGDLAVRLAPDRAAARLIELANEGGGADNITVVVIAIGEGSPSPDTHSLPVLGRSTEQRREADAGVAGSGSRLLGLPITCLTLIVLAVLVLAGGAFALARLASVPELAVAVDSPPIALAVGADGAVVVGERDGRVQVYDLGLADGPNVLSFSAYALGLRRPTAAVTWRLDGGEQLAALAVGSDGVYVVAGERLSVYTRAGQRVRGVSSLPGGQLDQTRAIAVDPAGRAYLARGAEVARLDAEGLPDSTWRVSSRVDLRAPAALALAPDGGLYVADADAGRVVRLDASGELAEAWTSAGGVQLASPQALALTPAGRLFVADVGQRVILEVGGAAGASPYRRDELGERLTLAADRAGNLYVGNSSTSRVTAVRPGGSLVRLIFGGR